ncbi:Ergosterol biosynthetic protein 28 [Penicillium chermesinum]|uniref:Ergosterol biosynthetic protein 28 n=1 Tax=Penicillium chermesinum TaxID=63820 RepID=A0A9W9TKK2_9EURO|nr:Ergosterol biosynthetic protein 28 [Penicillium chermesinum]KAJ5226191.1 Ergosterol biosynthetic protein 28 [Penicillium chermesinum]KAJ6160622.1 Ergosterol biosynthetic protein 28 [Penicillium chermesinum]
MVLPTPFCGAGRRSPSNSGINGLQAYASADYTSKLYTNGTRPVEALSGRVLSTWTFLSAVVRFTAAYNIDNPVALIGHAMSPLLVASSSLVWTLTQREFYLGA